MKKVLIPTDFSHQDAEALRYMFSFLKLMKSHIQIVFLNTYSVVGANVNNVIQENDLLKNESLKNLEQLKRDICKNYGFDDEDIIVVSEIGKALNVIPRIIKEHSIDMVIWNGHNHNKLQAVSEKVKLQNLTCSIVKVINPKG